MRILKLLAAAALAVFAASCDGGDDANTIRIGVAGPMTGPNAAFGAQLKNGVEQAVNDINAAGGILGKTIELVPGDDVGEPRQGVSVANQFSAEGIRFVVGHFNSSVSLPASSIYAENGVLMITPGSTNPNITDRGLWNVFRTCGRDDQQGKSSVNTSPRTSRIRSSQSFTTRRRMAKAWLMRPGRSSTDSA